MGDQLRSARISFSEMRGTVESLPRVTTRLNRAKREVVRVLEAMDRVIGVQVSMLDEIDRQMGSTDESGGS